MLALIIMLSCTSFFSPENKRLQDLQITAYTQAEVIAIVEKKASVSSQLPDQPSEPLVSNSRLTNEDNADNLFFDAPLLTDEIVAPILLKRSEADIRAGIDSVFAPPADLADVKNLFDERIKAKYELGMKHPFNTPGRSISHGDFVTSLFGVSITVGDFGRLLPGQWLNDEIINSYLQLLVTKAKQKGLKVACIRTTLHEKLLNEGVDSVKRWGRDMKYHKCDIVIVPINVSNIHWILVVVDIKQEQMRFYDSFHTPGRLYCQRIKEFFEQYFLLYAGNDNIDVTRWSMQDVQSFKAQPNRFDCGVYVCIFAELEMFQLPLSHCPKITEKLLSTQRWRIASTLLAGV